MRVQSLPKQLNCPYHSIAISSKAYALKRIRFGMHFMLKRYLAIALSFQAKIASMGEYLRKMTS